MGACTITFYELTGLFTHSNLIRTLLSLIVAIVVYFVVMLLLRTVTREELVQFPLGHRMYALAKKIKLME